MEFFAVGICKSLLTPDYRALKKNPFFYGLIYEFQLDAAYYSIEKWPKLNVYGKNMYSTTAV